MKAKVKTRLLYGRHHVLMPNGEICECCGGQRQSLMHVGRTRRIVCAAPMSMESVDWWWRTTRRSVLGRPVDL